MTDSGTVPVMQCLLHFVSLRPRFCGQPIYLAGSGVKSSRASYRIRHVKTHSCWRNGCAPRLKPPPTHWRMGRFPQQSASASQSRTMRVPILPPSWMWQIRRSIAPRRWVAIESSFRRIPRSHLLLGKHLGKPLRSEVRHLTLQHSLRIADRSPGSVARGTHKPSVISPCSATSPK